MVCLVCADSCLIIFLVCAHKAEGCVYVASRTLLTCPQDAHFHLHCSAFAFTQGLKSVSAAEHMTNITCTHTHIHTHNVGCPYFCNTPHRPHCLCFHAGPHVSGRCAAHDLTLCAPIFLQHSSFPPSLPLLSHRTSLSGRCAAHDLTLRVPYFYNTPHFRLHCLCFHAGPQGSGCCTAQDEPIGAGRHDTGRAPCHA